MMEKDSQERKKKIDGFRSRLVGLLCYPPTHTPPSWQCGAELILIRTQRAVWPGDRDWHGWAVGEEGGWRWGGVLRGEGGWGAARAGEGSGKLISDY